MAIIDSRAQSEYVIPGSILMENAGVAAVEKLVAKVWRNALPDGSFVFLAGKGNNAGDAFVMARRFSILGKQDICIILALGEIKQDSDAERNLSACIKMGIPVLDIAASKKAAFSTIESCTVLFDGLFGTGLKNRLSKDIVKLLQFVNKCSCIRMAIDIPSGLYDGYTPDQTMFLADMTLTMELPKECLYLPCARPLCGEILTVPVGFPEELTAADEIKGHLLLDHDIFELVPELPLHAYKKTRGHALVFAGSPGTTGAAVLAATAAGRSGAGLVTICTDEASYPIIASQCISIMTARNNDREIDFFLKNKKYTALCAGPGMGIQENTRNIIKRLVRLPVPKVIDADGISILAEIRKTGSITMNNTAILTPHPGECAHLLGCSVEELLVNPLPQLASLARELAAVIVLKAHISIIMSPDSRYWVYDHMNPGLGTGGTGDVLAGIITGLLAQKIPPLEAACAGVLIHGKIGMRAYEEMGWFLAEDLLPYISAAACINERNELWQ